MEDDFTEAIDQARGDRAEDTGISRLYTTFFIAVLGPMSILVMSILDFTPSQNILYGVFATAPVGVILGAINLVRMNRISMGAIWIFAFTLATAALTVKLT